MSWALIIAIAVISLIAIYLLLRQKRKERSIEWNQHLLAEAYNALAEGRLQQANTHYQKIVANLRRNGNTPQSQNQAVLAHAYIGLGQIAAKNHQTSETLDCYRRAIATGEAPLEILSEVAITDARNGLTNSVSRHLYSLYFNARKPSPTENDPVLSELQKQLENKPIAQEEAASLVALSALLLESFPATGWLFLIQGRALVEAEQLQDAIASLHAAELALPNRADIPYLLSSAYKKIGDTESAIAALRRSLRTNLSQPDVLYQLACYLVENANRDPDRAAEHLFDAEQALDSATDLAPSTAAYHQLLGKVQLAQGEIDGAITSFNRAIDLDLKNVDYRFELAQLLLQQKNAEQAVPLLRTVLKFDPVHHTARFALACWLLEDSEQLVDSSGDHSFSTKHIEEAKQHFQQLLGVSGFQNSEIQERLGRTLYLLGQYSKAVSYLESLQNSLSKRGLFVLGRSYSHSGDFQKAVTAYNLWLARFGPVIDVLGYVGLASYHQGLWMDALQFVERAQKLCDQQGVNRSDLLFYQAVLLSKLGKGVQAAAAFEGAVQLDPHSIEIKYAYARHLLAQGKLDEAKSRFETIIQDAPCHAPSLLGLGYIAEKREQFDIAIPYYSAALAANQEWKPSYARVGIAQVKSGLWAEGIDSFSRVGQQVEPSPEHLFWRAYAAAQSGQLREAIKLWQTLKTHEPYATIISTNLAIARYRIGYSFYERAQYPQALAEWQVAYQMAPDLTRLQYSLSEAALHLVLESLQTPSSRTSVHNDALQYLSEVAAPTSENSRLFYVLGIEALLANRGAVAVPYLARALALSPPTSRYQYYLALAYVAEGQLEAAQKLLHKLSPDAALFQPGYSIAQGNLAFLQGNLATARVAYTNIL